MTSNSEKGIKKKKKKETSNLGFGSQLPESFILILTSYL